MLTKPKYTKDDFINKKFDKLTVIDVILEHGQKSITKYGTFICKCDCGNNDNFKVKASSVIYGNTKSCGCLVVATLSERMKKYNTYDLSNEYGIGYTAKGEEFYFDLEDYNKIKKHCWHINSDNGYVYTQINDNNKLYNLSMHRYVLEEYNKDIYEPDHKNRIRHDNRKNNLRLAYHHKNMQNQGVTKNNTSGVTGVSWKKKSGLWEVSVSVNKKRIYIGWYKDFNEAVVARLKAEKQYYGEFAPQKHLFEQYSIKQLI